MTFAWRFRERCKTWRQSGRGRRLLSNPARPQLEMLEDRLAPSSTNVLPSIHFPAQDILAQGEVLSTTGSFSDPQGSSWTARVDYGDGTGLVSLPLQADQHFVLNHTYIQEGIFEVSVFVEDNLGAKALATLNVHAGALSGMPAIIANPVFPPVPMIPFGPLSPIPINIRPPSANGPFQGYTPGYLVETGEDFSASFKSDPVAAQVAREFPTENHAPTRITNANQVGTDTETNLLEKLQKTRATVPAGRPAPKKMADGKPDLPYQPKNDLLLEIKPDQSSFKPPANKKNLTILFRLQPAPFNRAEVATRLLEKGSPGNVLLAVLFMGWGIKRPKFRTTNRCGNCRPRKKSRWEFPEKAARTRITFAAARGPPCA